MRVSWRCPETCFPLPPNVVPSSSSPRRIPQAPDRRIRLPPSPARPSPARVQQSCHEESVGCLPGCFEPPPRLRGRPLPAPLCPTPRRRRPPRPLRRGFRGTAPCPVLLNFKSHLKLLTQRVSAGTGAALSKATHSADCMW